MPKASALDEYLEKIYILESEGVTVIGARVAEFMSVRAPTVTEALHRLVQRSLITMDEHHVISLTAEGRLKAEDTVRRHRVAERWLTDVIGLDWAQADEGAHKLAHAFSAEIVERLSKIMGEPTTCPHGNPIPGKLAATGLRGGAIGRRPPRSGIRGGTCGGARGGRLEVAAPPVEPGAGTRRPRRRGGHRARRGDHNHPVERP